MIWTNRAFLREYDEVARQCAAERVDVPSLNKARVLELA
jgi:hypothetical protein